ncbi:MAG: class I SAM-dependent methyltransferase [Pseudomonadota bacterium]
MLVITNKAIVNVILEHSPKTVLDVGCGKGWLSRELIKSNVITLGVDVVPAFIESAQNKGSGIFKKLSFDDLASGVLKEKFDIIVCNFSLLGKESVTKLFCYVPHMLNSGGSFVVQTIHPIYG